ncbi:hypothetical protein BC831DRAFT_464847, partial [Entophlyctis helioformis]
MAFDGLYSQAAHMAGSNYQRYQTLLDNKARQAFPQEPSPSTMPFSPQHPARQTASPPFQFAHPYSYAADSPLTLSTVRSRHGQPARPPVAVATRRTRPRYAPLHHHQPAFAHVHLPSAGPVSRQTVHAHPRGRLCGRRRPRAWHCGPGVAVGAAICVL